MTNRNYLLVKLLAVAVVAFLGASSARATILAQDNFNSYTAGLALTGGGGGSGTPGWGANLWLAPSGSGTLATVNNYSGDNKVDVSLTATATTVPAGRLLGGPIQQTFYASYVVSYFGVGTNAFGGNNTFGLILSDLTVPSTTVGANVINFGMRATTLSQPFGIRGGTTTGGSTTSGTVVPSTDYFLVAKLTYSGGFFDKGDLWVNPGPSLAETTPNATLSLAAGTGIAAINSIYFRQAANQVGDTYTINNLILATAWNDIVPVPEPGSVTLLSLGAAALWIFRRGHRRA